MRGSQPSPLWGIGWLASGVLISRGETGEGVETVSSPHPYRKTRSLTRTTGQTAKARELRRASTGWYLKACGYIVLRISNGMVFEAPGLFVGKVAAMRWSLPEALG